MSEYWLVSLPSGKNAFAATSAGSGMLPAAVRGGNFTPKQKIFFGIRSKLSGTISAGSTNLPTTQDQHTSSQASAQSHQTQQSTTHGSVAQRVNQNPDAHAHVTHFPVPDLKIGTLDGLMTLGDDLVKIDQFIDGVVRKLADTIKNLVKGDVQQMRSALSVNQRTVDSYLRSFMWNTTKYRADKSLQELADSIKVEVTGMETVLKNKLLAYNQTKNTLTSLERKQTGNLAVRSLTDVIRKEHFVLGSEYLQTLLVAIPRPLYKQWLDCYETLTTMVVPRSSTKIAEDDEYGLYNVTLFRRVADEFRGKARELRFIVRDVGYDENEMKVTKQEYEQAVEEEKDQWTTLMRLCKTNFGEIFQSWMHIKAIRLFVESVLRYGLPPDFLTCLIQPKKKHEKKARDVIEQFYDILSPEQEGQNVAPNGNAGAKKLTKKQAAEDEREMTVLLGGEKEYFDYASFTFKWDTEI